MPHIALGGEDRTDEQRDLRMELRRLLTRLWSDDHARELADGDRTTGAKLAAVLEHDIALGALLVPEELGGHGGGCVEAAVAAEELGAASAPSRLLGDAMSAHLLATSGDAELHRRLRRVVEDGVPAAVVWPAQDATWDLHQIHPVEITGAGASGRFRYVAEALDAALLLVPARRGAEFGLLLLDLSREGSGVELHPAKGADVLRPLGGLTVAGPTGEWVGLAEPQRVFTETVALGAIVLAAEMIGAARSCIERMATYAGQREQFGRTIGSFQALRHQIVDALVAWEAARAMTYRAAAGFAAMTRGTARIDDVEPMARMAKAAASDALGEASETCIHVYGAIGFTWENPVHLAFKRWAASAQIFGSPTEQRVRVCQHAIINAGGRAGGALRVAG
ncbi:Acyl-CoA dehydrogenase [Pseudonocardia thermophila]|uniref:Acyl-CoA dehydrogenase n=1 Tax=Pseudonocardia thermophila TaxID=1848 RepID=A0A1M6XQI6_PSETH|nr:acyl-CoA dehydrogenase family protein [Pseudonocardia thermophila]SHL08214.1 Acyl-CoA dehydrogenase [Pseudonocardia thermophila]